MFLHDSSEKNSASRVKAKFYLSRNYHCSTVECLFLGVSFNALEICIRHVNIITSTKPTKFQACWQQELLISSSIPYAFSFPWSRFKILKSFPLPSVGKVYKLFEGFSRPDKQHVHLADTHSCLHLACTVRRDSRLANELTFKTRHSGFRLVKECLCSSPLFKPCHWKL